MLYLGNELVYTGKFGDNALKMYVPTPDDWTITWYYEGDEEIFALQCLRRHYEGIPMKLRMEYVPHARQDRVKNYDDVFTLKYFCEIINSLGFEKVTIVDPHSDVCVELLNNVEVIWPTEHVKKVINYIGGENLVFFYPDKGAFHRYSPLYQNMNVPVAHGVKVRNWESGRVTSLEINDPSIISGKNILIIDDICSYGGTFARAAKKLKEAGAKDVYLYVTHCEDNIHKGDIFKEGNIKEVFTTTSLYHPGSEPEDANYRVKIIGEKIAQ